MESPTTSHNPTKAHPERRANLLAGLNDAPTALTGWGFERLDDSTAYCGRTWDQYVRLNRIHPITPNDRRTTK